MAFDQKQLRLVMRQWSTGVSVVSTLLNGKKHGMTVSSFTSVSIDPQIVVVSLMKISRTHDFVIEAGFFGITILSDTQKFISEIFAGQVAESENRFDGIDTFEIKSGSPLIFGGLAFMDCAVIDVIEFQSNSLIFGEVLAAEVGETGKPLLYYNQHYHKLQE